MILIRYVLHRWLDARLVRNSDVLRAESDRQALLEAKARLSAARLCLDYGGYPKGYLEWKRSL